MADIKVGRYLFERIAQLGIKTIFGVPGDYELVILDMIPEAGLTWRGNPNELVASYAADGYARVNGAAAFVSTFGPGELSAYCGVAGQYTEYVPVVHIVGYPSATAMKSHAIMHHSLGDGKFGMYHEMSRYITVASTVIDNTNTAAAEIDRVLNAMLYYNRPVYIGVAVDIGPQLIPSTGLKTPLITSLPPNDSELEAKVVFNILDLLQKCERPIVLVDGGAVRNNVIEESTELVKTLSVPYFVTSMGKGGISECLGNFGGVYGGAGSFPETKSFVESSDLVLHIGNYPSDFNTGEFTEQINPTNVVDFQRFTVEIAGIKYKTKMKYVLQHLTKRLPEDGFKVSQVTKVSWEPYPADFPAKPEVLSQDFLWPALGRYFRPGDFIVAETGTSAFGIPLCNLTNVDNVKMYNQTIYGSIGYATGASLGSFVAGKEDGSIRRGILITGEGSLQLTVQALADHIRHGINTTIFVLNNDGYTVERLIHGMEAAYNKVPDWNYSKMCKFFGPSFKSNYYRVATPDQLLEVLQNPEFNAAECTQVVELILHKHDAPVSVKLVTAFIEDFNKVKAK